MKVVASAICQISKSLQNTKALSRTFLEDKKNYNVRLYLLFRNEIILPSQKIYKKKRCIITAGALTGGKILTSTQKETYQNLNLFLWWLSWCFNARHDTTCCPHALAISFVSDLNTVLQIWPDKNLKRIIVFSVGLESH